MLSQVRKKGMVWFEISVTGLDKMSLSQMAWYLSFSVHAFCCLHPYTWKMFTHKNSVVSVPLALFILWYIDNHTMPKHLQLQVGFP
jgi:hypothetical protein